MPAATMPVPSKNREAGSGVLIAGEDGVKIKPPAHATEPQIRPKANVLKAILSALLRIRATKPRSTWE